MNRRQTFGLAAGILAQALAFTALADKQKLAEGSLSVNVNNATLDELITLPEIGPEIARAIVSHRPYGRVEDLLRVKGIGRFTLGSIRPYVKVKGKTEPYKPQ